MRFGVFDIINFAKAASVEDLKKLEEQRAIDAAEQKLRGEQAAARVAALAAQRAQAQAAAPPPAKAKRGRPAGKTALGPPTHIYRVQMRSGAWWKRPQYFHASTEHTRAQWLYSIAKRGGRAYEVDPHTGEMGGTHVALPARLTREKLTPLTYEQVVASGASVPAEAKRQPTVERIELQRVQRTRKVDSLYVRLGDQASKIDPKGAEQLKALKKLEGALDQIDERLDGIEKEIRQAEKLGDPTSIPKLVAERTALDTTRLNVKAQHDKLLNTFMARPGAWTLSRVAAVKEEIRQAKKEGREWIEANPEAWKELQKEHARRAKHAEKLAKQRGSEVKASTELQYPPHITAELNRLKWKLKGVSGRAQLIERKGKAVGVGKHIILSASDEKEGLRPEEGIITYLLTTGQWKNQLDGRNVFNEDENEALYAEYAGVINNIVHGNARGGGWARLFDLKDLANEMRGHLNEMLLEYAKVYTPQMSSDAREGRGVLDLKGRLVDQGQPRNFRSFIISRLSGEARNFMRNRLQEAKDRREIGEGKIAEYENALSWDEEGALTRDQLRETDVPLGTQYLPADDVVALNELKALLVTRVKGPVGTGRKVPLAGSGPDDFAVALFSRLNLHNPVTDPKGEGKGGLKSWDEVAADVLAARRKRFLQQLKSRALRQKDPARRAQLLAQHAAYTERPGTIPEMQSAHSLKQELVQSLGRMFSLKAAQRAAAEGGFGEKSDWLGEMTAADMRSLKHGLRTLIKVTGSPTVAPSASLPSRSTWRISREPTGKREGTVAKPGRSVAVHELADVHHVVDDPKLGVPVTGAYKTEPLLAHGGVTALHFWRTQRRPPPSAARPKGGAFFDPAVELDLGMDLYGVSGMTAGLPMHVKIKQMRAAHLRKVWQAMDNLSDKQLAALPGTPAFKKYSQQWEGAMDAAHTKQATEYAATGELPKKRVALAVKPLQVGKVSIERVRPGDVVRIAELIRKQRAIDAGEAVVAKSQKRGKKGKKVKPDAELLALMAQLRRLLGVK